MHYPNSFSKNSNTHAIRFVRIHAHVCIRSSERLKTFLVVSKGTHLSVLRRSVYNVDMHRMLNSCTGRSFSQVNSFLVQASRHFLTLSLTDKFHERCVGVFELISEVQLNRKSLRVLFGVKLAAIRESTKFMLELLYREKLTTTITAIATTKKGRQLRSTHITKAWQPNIVNKHKSAAN